MNKLRICLIHNYTHALDEGMAKVSYALFQYLSKRNEVLYVKNCDILKKNQLKSIRNFQPHILHHIPGPSFNALLLALTLKKIFNTRLVLSATRPEIPMFPSKLLTSVYKPDLVFVQAFESELLFRTLGCKTVFLPNGVDLQKFCPVNLDDKQLIKQRFGFSSDAFVILHVGPIKQGRNMLALAKLAQDKRYQVVIVGSTTTPVESNIYRELLDSGCLVFNEFFEKIEELYWASDLYVFPTFEPLNCIETPLSVLEAMSTNLPVVTTKYGALSRLFTEGDGLFFAENEDDLFDKIRQAKDIDKVKTRSKVFRYSWGNICKTIESFYRELLVSESSLEGVS